MDTVRLRLFSLISIVSTVNMMFIHNFDKKLSVMIKMLYQIFDKNIINILYNSRDIS